MERDALQGFTVPMIVVVAVVVLMAFIVSQPSDFFPALVQAWGLPGLFLVAVAANATLFLPVPLDILVFALGSSGDLLASGPTGPIIIALVAGLGAAIGEMSAYVLGFLGAKGIERWKHEHTLKLQEAKERIKHAGMVFIFLGALTPFPFDIVGIAAGLIRYDVPRFFLAAFLGKVVRYGALVYAGYFSIEIVRVFFGL